MKEYSEGKNLQEASKVIRFADFIHCEQFYDAVTSAVACAFFFDGGKQNK